MRGSYDAGRQKSDELRDQVPGIGESVRVHEQVMSDQSVTEN